LFIWNFTKKQGTGLLSNTKLYSIPIGKINESNISNYLDYPIWYKDTLTINSHGGKSFEQSCYITFHIAFSVRISKKSAKFYFNNTISGNHYIWDGNNLLSCWILTWSISGDVKFIDPYWPLLILLILLALIVLINLICSY
jgi:hypothetical protein